MKRLIVGAVVSCALASSAAAQTALTRAQNEANINATIKTNSVGAITGAILNTQLNDLAASMATGLDPNTFSQPQTLSSGAIGTITGHASLDLAVSSLGASVATLLGGASTGTGGPVGSISPTISNLNVTDVVGSSIPALDVTTLNHASYTTPGAQIVFNVDYGSFGDLNTTFGLVVLGGKSVNAAATTGSWQMASFRYIGFGGGDSSAFITAGQELMDPTVSTSNNAGHYFGNNPEVFITTGFTPTEATGEEIDLSTLSNVSTDRHGLRIIDIGSTGSHATDDSGMSILSSGIGWTMGLEFGSVGGNFPIAAGGTLITSTASTLAMNAGINFQSLTGTPTLAWLALPPNQREICFGSGTCNAGSINSTATTGGGIFVFANGSFTFNFASTEASISSTGVINAVGGYSANGTAGVSGSTCTAWTDGLCTHL